MSLEGTIVEVIVLATPAEVAEAAAALVAQVVIAKPKAVIGFATGSSPLGIYAALARRAGSRQLDFSSVTGFALDEYVGLSPSDPRSYASVIDREVTARLGLRRDNVHVPDGEAHDLGAACSAYEAAIDAAGGVDIQILGLGANGHIGFNEPTSSLVSHTRVKTLAQRTLSDNARFFANAESVPTHCVTQGLGTIMRARKIVLVAQGATKAAAVAAVVEGPVSSMWPGSVLQNHEHVVVLVDSAAGAQLCLRDYYQQIQEHKSRVSPDRTSAA
jgi:glucosamine-6-phosphate deaminase